VTRDNRFLRLGKVQKTLLAANIGLWIYFVAGFVQSSYPFRSNPLGHPAGTGYTFWGHSIAVVESGLVYPFFRVLFCAEFPSFLFATLIARAISPDLLINWFFLGISGGGWLLVAVMVVSFVQWYLIGWMVQKLWQKWSVGPTGKRNHDHSHGRTRTDEATSTTSSL